MEVIFLLIGLSMVMGGIFLTLYIRTARTGGFDDLQSPAIFILKDNNQSKTQGDNEPTK